MGSGLMPKELQKPKEQRRPIVLAIADISTAFLHAELPPDTKIYVRAPKEAGGGVWLMKRALYGLRASPKAWQQHLKEQLQQVDFKATRADTSFYAKAEGSPQYLMAHVDDLGIVGYEDEVMSTHSTSCSRI